MEIDIIPFNQNELQRIVKGGIVENFNLSRTHKGYKKLELKIYYPTGHRKFFMLIDKGCIIDRREIIIHPFDDKKTRDKEIRRLYIEEKMTQSFIANIFGLTQPTISGIINS